MTKRYEVVNDAFNRGLLEFKIKQAVEEQKAQACFEHSENLCNSIREYLPCVDNPGFQVSIRTHAIQVYDTKLYREWFEITAVNVYIDFLSEALDPDDFKLALGDSEAIFSVTNTKAKELPNLIACYIEGVLDLNGFDTTAVQA